MAFARSSNPNTRESMPPSRVIGLLLSLVLATCATDCTEPECPMAKKRVGMRCLSLPRADDSGLEPTAEEAREPMESDAAAGKLGRDADTIDADVGKEADARLTTGGGNAQGVQLDDGGSNADPPEAGPLCVSTLEVCNGNDDDCDQSIDEDATEDPIGEPCDNGGEGVCAKSGKHVCFKGAVVCDAPPAKPVPEVCDGVDNDCDGTPDNGLVNACKGSECGANLKLLTTSCSAGADDCKNEGTWECDPSAGNNALRCSAKEKPKNSCGVSCGPVPADVCDGVDNDCTGGPDTGLTNVCGGSQCLAKLDDLNKDCTVTEGECVGSGTWKCDESRQNNVLVCQVAKRVPLNVAGDPSFEQQTSYSLSPPWGNFKGAYIGNDAHTGTHAATIVCDKLNSTSDIGWNDIYNRVPVTPNTAYKVEAWIKTSPNLAYGRLSVRSSVDYTTEYTQNLGYSFGPLPKWTYVSTRFSVDASTRQADVYIGGSDSNGEATTVFVDDVTVTREQSCF